MTTLPDDLADAFSGDDPGPAPSGQQEADAIDWTEVQANNVATADPAMVAAVKAGTVTEPDFNLADSLRAWGDFVCCMPPLEREVAIADRVAVLCGLYPNAGEMCRAALAEAAARRVGCRPDEGPFVNWTTFWDREHSEAEWTYDDVLARGRGHAIYATHKTGKSLLMLYLAAQIVQRPDHAVLYLDYEMTEADLFDRLDDMGYDAGSDFSRLKYALLPSLPPLDTSDGADALMDLVAAVKGELPACHLTAVIDTMSRAVRGEENDADTFRNFYNHTGIRLKREGLTWARLDHAGKDPARGQRGSSSKGDDVDVIWKLAKTQNGLELKREAARMSWVPDHIFFKRSDNPLRYVRMVADWPDGTKETALHLDRLDAPVEITVRDARRVLADHGVKTRTALVSSAVRWRKQRERTGDSA